MNKTKGATGIRVLVYALIITAIALTVFVDLLAGGLDITPKKTAEPIQDEIIMPVVSETDEISESDAEVSETDEPKEPEKILPEAIELSVITDYTVIGSTVQIKPHITPVEASTADLVMIWKSSDENVASVDESGTVTAIGKGTATVTARAENGVSTYIQIKVIPDGKVYLSPSNQVWYEYPVGDTNESRESRRISEYCAERLAMAGIESLISKNSLTVEERIEEAQKAKADTYVSIHTKNFEEYGVRIAFNKYMTNSSRLTLCIKDRLTPIINTKTKGYAVSGLDKNYKELETEEAGLNSTVVEVQSHIDKKNAQWIIDNSKEIGYAIAEGILQYYLTKLG